MASPKSDNPIGRPSLYKPEYCDLVIEVMQQGLGLNSFAAAAGVSRRTVTEWMEVHSEFAEAVSRAKAFAASWYEMQQKKHVEVGGTSSQATLIVFGLTNLARTDWQSKAAIEVEHSGTISHMRDMSDAELEAIVSSAYLERK
ncbi:hypothetical protein [Phyllobacterium sp. SB3]|uniref:hypothetical protein n=1 Tax=Phyllobacterium sp. SB3 TaxID=3156073 RepID=UPI0032AEEB29